MMLIPVILVLSGAELKDFQRMRVASRSKTIHKKKEEKLCAPVPDNIQSLFIALMEANATKRTLITQSKESNQ